MRGSFPRRVYSLVFFLNKMFVLQIEYPHRIPAHDGFSEVCIGSLTKKKL